MNLVTVNTEVWQTDGRTTFLYQYRVLLSMRTHDRNTCTLMKASKNRNTMLTLWKSSAYSIVY